MPHVVIAAAQWVGMTVFQAATAAGASITTAATLANVAVAATAVAAVASVGAVTKALSPKVGGDLGSQIDFKADPRGPIPYPVGRTATAGSAVMVQACGPSNKYLNYVTVLGAAGPMDSFESFLVNGAAITFGTDGGEGASGYYQNRMWRKAHLGGPAETYLHWTATGTKDTPADHGGMPAEWTSAHTLKGYAADLWALQYNTTIYSGGQPKRLVVGKWVKVYDPRLDDTYPGGAGDHRILDETTYEWSDNPYLHALTWCLGRHVNGKRTLGVGIPAVAIDIAAFVEGANIAEANGWKVGGVPYSNDDKYEVLKAFLQAGGGKPMRLGAKMSCLVNTPRVSLATLTAADVIGEASITGTQSRRARLNTIWPKYREEAQGWEMVPMDAPVQVASYVTEDQGERSREIEYSLVQDATQAVQLARYDIEDAREFSPVVLPCKPRWRGYKPGDVITVDEPEYGLNGQDMLILQRRTDPLTMAVTLTLRSETSAKHPFALGETGTAPATPGLTGIDPAAIADPEASDFTFVGVTLTSAAVSFPALQVSGTIEENNAAELVIRYRVDGTSDWSQMSVAASRSLMTVDITAVAAGETYEAEIAYVSVRGTQSGWTSLGTAVAGDFTFAELAALLWADPAKNLYRKADWVAAGGAVFRDRTPLGLGVANGASGWGFRFPAATNDARITVPGKVNGLISTGDRYAAQFVAFLSAGSGTAQIRAGWRDAGGGTISDLADQIYTVTTTPTRFVWDGFGSNDADFTTAVFRIFELTGDIASGQSVDVTDLQMEYGGRASSGWRPSPDDQDLLAYAGYYGDLGATKNSIYGPTGTTPSSPTNGDFWIDNSTSPVVLKQRVAGAWVVGAANGGSFGNNLYHTPGGSLATLSNFLTSSGTAAAIAGQGPLATAPNPVATLQYLDSNGQFSDWRGFGNPNGAAGMGAVFDSNPLTADNRYCYIAAFNLKGQNYTRACGSGTIDFGGPDATFGVVMHWAGGYYGAILVEDIDLYVSAGGWLYLGTVKTSNGGVFTPPTNIYDGYIPDFGGVYGGVVP